MLTHDDHYQGAAMRTQPKAVAFQKKNVRVNLKTSMPGCHMLKFPRLARATFSVAAAVVAVLALNPVAQATEPDLPGARSAVSLAQVPTAFNLPTQPLADALRAVAGQTNSNILFDRSLVRGMTAKPLKAELSVIQALETLLAGTGLTYRMTDDKTVMIVPSSEPGVSQSGSSHVSQDGFSSLRLAQADSQPGRASDSPAKTKDEKTGEVVVTGTHIRGARPTSHVVTITQEQMRLSGHNNLGEVIRALPQNFSGGQNPGVQVGSGEGATNANQNITGSSSLNLRGLGADATLTLLNGTRLPYDGFTQATDVASIPTVAVARMEILLDGASAIYGSDAVGGVANIVLKRDYKGAEVSARFGAATDGGYGQRQYTAIAGNYWGSGGFMVTGDYSDSESVKAKQRDYLSQLTNQNIEIYPQSTQKGALFSGHQDVGAFATLNLDAFYTRRTIVQKIQFSASSDQVGDGATSIWGVAPSLDFELPGEWSARLHGAFGENDVEKTQTNFSLATGEQTSDLAFQYLNQAQSAGAEFQGPLFDLPGGNVRASVGGGWRRTTFLDLVTGRASPDVDADDSSYYVYGEVDVPLVAEDQNIPLMARLALNAAVRHEEYDSFGGSTTPRIGVIWGLTPSFDLKASWGRSFKVPRLSEQFNGNQYILWGGALFGLAPDEQLLLLAGGNPGLEPEEAEITTAGFVARPEFLPGFDLEFSYFDIDYTDRVGYPIDAIAQTLTNPAFAPFVIMNPTIAQQEEVFAMLGLPFGEFTDDFLGMPYDPPNVAAFVDDRDTNISSQHVKGIDLTARYITGLMDGELSLSANANWITEGTRRIRADAPALPVVGVNFWPAKFKGRFGAGWSREGFTLSANVNHIAGITNRLVTPNVKLDSMATVDLIVDYQWISDIVGDVGFNLAVTNALNQAPPFLMPAQPFHVNYDSTNYSALGRVVSATLTKRF